jgi:hypothetical protein
MMMHVCASADSAESAGSVALLCTVHSNEVGGIRVRILKKVCLAGVHKKFNFFPKYAVLD